MGDSVIDMTNLSFSVSGASIDLGGTYNMDNGAMNFSGKLRLDAKLSQTTTGANHFF